MATPFGALDQGTLPFVRDRERSPTPKLDDVSLLGDLALRKVIILGIPGAGKTTLVDTLRESNPAINYLSLGAISRGLDPDSPHRRALDELFAIGRPIGDPDLFLQILGPHVDRAMEDTGGFILDGVPKKVTEVEALLEFLSQKSADPEAIISCEISPLEAHRRIMERASRPGDPDSLDIFLNRTKTYLRDLDDFKDGLAREQNRPLIVVNTERTSAETAARAIELLTNPGDRVRIDASGEGKEAVTEHVAKQLFEAIKSGDRLKAHNIYGQLFDDFLPEINHGKVIAQEFDSYRQAYVEMALTVKSPELLETPRFLQRFAGNYISTTLMSIKHLLDSIEEEVVLRKGEDYTVEDIAEILNQQIQLKRLIDYLQESIVENKNLSTLVEKELVANLPELQHIDTIFQNRAVALGIDIGGMTAHDFMKLQPQLWGQLTSNQVLLAPDFNYRRDANGLPDAHHSLLPFTRNRRAMNANSMGDYIPFVEAVSATDNEFSSTFGFIHFVGMNDNGEAFGIEYPLMMHDQRLIDLNNATIQNILTMGDAFYGNHDLWHNMLPVFSKSFILHHPDAPLSYGGRLPAYLDFGNGLRWDKEEYEIGVAMAHKRTQLERFEKNPGLERKEAGLLLTALEDLKNLPDELAGQCSAEEIRNIVDYLGSMVATKAYNVFPDNHPLYSEIERLLLEIGVKPMTISASEVAELLLTQGLINTNRLEGLEQLSQSEVRKLIKEDGGIASRLIKECIDTDSQGRESGSEHIVNALNRWGVLTKLSDFAEAELGALEKSRWLAMTAPQRQQLKGHMEKVHGKPGYVFNGELVDDPRDLVLMQHTALQRDRQEYEYRMEARKENQRLSYQLYSLLFDDDQDIERMAREELTILRNSEDTGRKLYAREAASVLDELLHDLVANKYSLDEEVLSYLESYIEALSVYGSASALLQSMQDIVKRYGVLARQEAKHQEALGITYASASQTLSDEHMDIA